MHYLNNKDKTSYNLRFYFFVVLTYLKEKGGIFMGLFSNLFSHDTYEDDYLPDIPDPVLDDKPIDTVVFTEDNTLSDDSLEDPNPSLFESLDDIISRFRSDGTPNYDHLDFDGNGIPDFYEEPDMRY